MDFTSSDNLYLELTNMDEPIVECRYMNPVDLHLSLGTRLESEDSSHKSFSARSSQDSLSSSEEVHNDSVQNVSEPMDFTNADLNASHMQSTGLDDSTSFPSTTSGLFGSSFPTNLEIISNCLVFQDEYLSETQWIGRSVTPLLTATHTATLCDLTKDHDRVTDSDKMSALDIQIDSIDEEPSQCSCSRIRQTAPMNNEMYVRY